MTKVPHKDIDTPQEISRSLINPPYGSKTKVKLGRDLVELKICRYNGAKYLRVQSLADKELVFYVKTGTTTIIRSNEPIKDHEKALQLESFKKRALNSYLPRQEALKELNKKPSKESKRTVAGSVALTQSRIAESRFVEASPGEGIKPLESNTNSRYITQNDTKIRPPQEGSRIIRKRRIIPKTPLEKLELLAAKTKTEALAAAKKIAKHREKYPKSPTIPQDLRPRSGAITPPEAEKARQAAQRRVNTARRGNNLTGEIKPPSPPADQATHKSPVKMEKTPLRPKKAIKKPSAKTPEIQRVRESDAEQRAIEARKLANKRIKDFRLKQVADSRGQAPNPLWEKAKARTEPPKTPVKSRGNSRITAPVSPVKKARDAAALEERARARSAAPPRPDRMFNQLPPRRNKEQKPVGKYNPLGSSLRRAALGEGLGGNFTHRTSINFQG